MSINLRLVVGHIGLCLLEALLGRLEQLLLPAADVLALLGLLALAADRASASVSGVTRQASGWVALGAATHGCTHPKPLELAVAPAWRTSGVYERARVGWEKDAMVGV